MSFLGKYRPILFGDEMVRAILDGKKTQTRRIVSYNNILGYSDDWCPKAKSYELSRIIGDYARFCPFGYIDDKLWVREAFSSTKQIGEHPADAYFVYRATDPDWSTMEGWKWKPSIHMPRDASRITLKIVNLRVERLQDISEDDARAEGIDSDCGIGNINEYLAGPYSYAFAIEWNKMYEKKHPWETNPWVWVIEFKKVD